MDSSTRRNLKIVKNKVNYSYQQESKFTMWLTMIAVGNGNVNLDDEKLMKQRINL